MMLKPLVRVLIQNEFTHADFIELSKRAYVETAYEKFSITGRKTTIARVAVLTGLSRKEVVRLNKQGEQKIVLGKSSPNRAMRVVNGWLRDKEFLDADGQPLQLPLQGDTGSFASLVARYSGDISLGAIADELARTGVIERSDDQITLCNLGYVPDDSEIEKIRIMSLCVADLLETATHNIHSDEKDKRMQRQLIYNQMPLSLVQEFKQYSTDKAANLLQDLNQFLSEKKEEHSDEVNNAGRVGLGIYYIEGLNQQADSTTEESKK